MTMALSNGYQAALMAPTEVLARQHYEKLTAIFEKAQLFPGRAALLTGSVRASERRRILDGLKDGSISVVIGTHALFQEGVSYNRLALGITDEQHRFGVRQRQALMEKGETPHLLIMSATPIPRTLGVIYYGDMDISVIDGRPGRRKAIKNAVVDSGWKEKAIHFIEKQLGEGRQAYVICPMIEASEGLEAANVHDEAAALRKSLPGRRITMLHGQMKPEEKNDVMEKFLRGDADVLVSTTVVEVGVAAAMRMCSSPPPSWTSAWMCRMQPSCSLKMPSASAWPSSTSSAAGWDGGVISHTAFLWRASSPKPSPKGCRSCASPTTDLR